MKKILIFLTIFLFLSSFAFAQEPAGGDIIGEPQEPIITIGPHQFTEDDVTEIITTTGTPNELGTYTETSLISSGSTSKDGYTFFNNQWIKIIEDTITVGAGESAPLVVTINNVETEVLPPNTQITTAPGDSITVYVFTLGSVFRVIATNQEIAAEPTPISTGDGFTPGPIPDSLKTGITEDEIITGLLDFLPKERQAGLLELFARGEADAGDLVAFAWEGAVLNEFAIHDPLKFAGDVMVGAAGGDVVIGGIESKGGWIDIDDWEEYVKKQKKPGVCECYYELNYDWLCNQETSDGRHQGNIAQGTVSESGTQAPPHGDECETHTLVCGVKCMAAIDKKAKDGWDTLAEQCRSGRMGSRTRFNFRYVFYPLEPPRPWGKARCVEVEAPAAGG